MMLYGYRFADLPLKCTSVEFQYIHYKIYDRLSTVFVAPAGRSSCPDGKIFVTILATDGMGVMDMTVLQRVIGRIGTSDPLEGAKDISES